VEMSDVKKLQISWNSIEGKSVYCYRWAECAGSRRSRTTLGPESEEFMSIKYKLFFSRLKVVVGIVFWIVPFYLLLPQLSIDVENLLIYVQISLGVVFYMLSLFLILIDYKYDIIKLLFNIILLFPVSLCLYIGLYIAMIMVLSIVSIRLYGIPVDIF